MDDWEKFNKTSEKEDFYSHLNMEDITDANYTPAKRDFKITNLCGYYDLCIKSETLLLGGVFENF